MKTKVDNSLLYTNSIFLIGPKNDNCTEEKDTCGLLFLQFDP